MILLRNLALAVIVWALALPVGCADTHRPDPFDDLLTALPPAPPPSPPEDPRPRSEVAERACAVEPAEPTATRALTRDAVRTLLAGGFGRFLSRVQVSPVLTRGRFVGFRLECATDLPRWQAAGADVRVGDVITRINGRSIELPDVAFAVFESLGTAPELTVEIVRGDTAMTLHQAIVDSPPAATH